MSDKEPMMPLSLPQMAEAARAVASYEASIDKATADYLMGRGIDRATAERFRLGTVRVPEAGHARMRGMLCIPYLLADGSPLTMRFRCMEEHNHRDSFHGKYNSLSGDPSRTFNVGGVLAAGDEIHVTEGEFDAMILARIGLHAVAIPGANGWGGHHARMLAGFSKVFVWGDPDEAGADFTRMVTKAMRQGRGVSLKAGDVTDTYLEGGEAALFSLMEEVA